VHITITLCIFVQGWYIYLLQIMHIYTDDFAKVELGICFCSMFAGAPEGWNVMSFMERWRLPLRARRLLFLPWFSCWACARVDEALQSDDESGWCLISMVFLFSLISRMNCLSSRCALPEFDVKWFWALYVFLYETIIVSLIRSFSGGRLSLWSPWTAQCRFPDR